MGTTSVVHRAIHESKGSYPDRVKIIRGCRSCSCTSRMHIDSDAKFPIFTRGRGNGLQPARRTSSDGRFPNCSGVGRWARVVQLIAQD